MINSFDRPFPNKSISEITRTDTLVTLINQAAKEARDHKNGLTP